MPPAPFDFASLPYETNIWPLLLAVIDFGGAAAASKRYGRSMEPGIVAADLVVHRILKGKTMAAW